MCTSISFSRPALYGRNLDLEVSFGERVVITPRDYPFPFTTAPRRNTISRWSAWRPSRRACRCTRRR